MYAKFLIFRELGATKATDPSRSGTINVKRKTYQRIVEKQQTRYEYIR